MPTDKSQDIPVYNFPILHIMLNVEELTGKRKTGVLHLSQ